MAIAYFPGCTLKTTGKVLEESALKVAQTLEMDIQELPQWTCCGTCFSLAEDDLMRQLAPIRNLARAEAAGFSVLTTLCSVCYNTLVQANHFVKASSQRLEKINNFMEEEPDYHGRVEVKHFIKLLQELGADKIKEAVKSPLTGLKVACYYGCLLLRPKIVAIDNMEQPTIMEDLVKCLGAEPVYFPYQVECCGSYHTAVKPDIVAHRAYKILNNARENGAQVVVTVCPLCYFNLKNRQLQVKELYPEFRPMPVLYFTELMAQALGLETLKELEIL